MLTRTTFEGQTTASGSKTPAPSQLGVTAPRLPAKFVPLVELLRSQRAEGRARTTCSYIATVLRRQNHPWVNKTWSPSEYINQAANLGLLTVDWSDTGADGWVTLSEYGRTATLPITAATVATPSTPSMGRAATPSTPSTGGAATLITTGKKKAIPKRFEPLRALFEQNGRDLLNGGVVGELRRSHPKLIPSGSGEVKAYIEDAITAGVVKYDGDRREWLKLVR
jgi:hypothetical protein